MPFTVGTGTSPYYRRPTTVTPTVTVSPQPDFAQMQNDLDRQYADIDAQLAALQSSPSYKPPVGNLSLGLPRLSLSTPIATDTTSDYASTAQAAPAASGSPTGSYTGGGGGGYGLGAYGFSGNSGQASQRGKAKYGFQPTMWQALQAANAAMAKAGLGTFGITDGFRSYESQVDLKKRNPGLAATPGRSVHGIGLAADLRLTPKQQKWLDANKGKFNLIRLPSEPWHFQLDPRAYKR